MKFTKISITILFACCMLFLVHFLHTRELEKREYLLHREVSIFVLTLIDERVSALGLEEEETLQDLMVSLSDYFDLEEQVKILVFRSDSGELIYPAGIIERTVQPEIFDAVQDDIEGEIQLEDRIGYIVRYDPLNMVVLVYTLKSELYLVRNQILTIMAAIIFVYALVLFFIDLRTKRRIGIVTREIRRCFESAFTKRGKLLEPIGKKGEKRVDEMVDGYNAMVRKAEKIFGQMESRIQTLFQQRENLKKIISLYKKYSQAETVLRISEKNLSDLESKRQFIACLSVELVDYLEPVDELYPQVITNELTNFYNFVKTLATHSGGLINFSYGYFMNVVFGAPKSDQSAFLHAIEGSRQIQKWIEERNRSERNVSGVKWEAKMGISHGSAVTGTVGDEYVTIGTAVERSMRMLVHAQYYGVPLVSDCLEQIEALKELKFRRLDIVQEGNGGKGTEIFEIFLKESHQLDDAIRLYYHGLDMFFDGKYEVAVFDFKKVNQIFHGDNPSIIFLKRCENYIKSD